MVQSWYGGWNIWLYFESAWESHIVLLYEWLQNYFETKEPIGREWCKILQKARTANPSASTMLAVAQWQMSFLWKELNTRKQHVKTVKYMAKTAEDSAKEATKRKQDEHILLKVQDTDLAAREAHYHATCRRDYTREDDRHQETIKDTKTIEEQASNKTT